MAFAVGLSVCSCLVFKTSAANQEPLELPNFATGALGYEAVGVQHVGIVFCPRNQGVTGPACGAAIGHVRVALVIASLTCSGHLQLVRLLGLGAVWVELQPMMPFAGGGDWFKAAAVAEAGHAAGRRYFSGSKAAVTLNSKRS